MSKVAGKNGERSSAAEETWAKLKKLDGFEWIEQVY